MKPLLLLALALIGCGKPEPKVSLSETPGPTVTLALPKDLRLPASTMEPPAVSGLCNWTTHKVQGSYLALCWNLAPSEKNPLLGTVQQQANAEPIRAFVGNEFCGSGEFRTIDEAKRCVEGTLKLQEGMK